MKQRHFLYIRIYFGVDLLGTCLLLAGVAYDLFRKAAGGLANGPLGLALLFLLLAVYGPCAAALLGAAVSLGFYIRKPAAPAAGSIVMAVSAMQLLVCAVIHPPHRFFYANAHTPFAVMIGIQMVMCAVRLLLLLFVKGTKDKSVREER